MRAASPERRRLFGHRLRQRREDELGFTERRGGRRAFEAATGWDTRNAFDMENAKRANFKEETLRKAMRAYQLTRTSARAFLLGESDELIPASAPGPPVPGTLGPSPFADAAREAAAFPFALAIWQRLYRFAVAGQPDPPGAELFPDSGEDAADWDSPRDRELYSLEERVWIAADVQARQAARGRQGIALAAPATPVMVPA